MKKWFKKGLTLTMAVLMLVLALTGCGGGSEVVGDGGFRVSVPSKSDTKSEELYQASLDRLQSLTDVPITWDFLGGENANNALKLQISAGDFPEVVIGNRFQPSEISQYAAGGVLIPIEDYINKKDTPNIYKLFEERPAIKAASVAPDGHIYTLPGLQEFMPNSIENILWINKAWLDKLNLEVPKTLDELKVVLKAFKEQDPNGNGQADEIPMSFRVKDSYAYPEALLSCWGMATKFGSYDSWLTVQDGEVKFAPVLDEWKEMIAYYRDLYAEGLLDMEAFTQNREAFVAKQSAATSKIGLIWSSSNAMANADEYVAIEPPSADGKIQPVWRIHPGYIGTRDFLVIFKECKNPAEVLKWADKFYEFDQSVQNAFGEYGSNSSVIKNDQGVVTWVDPPEGKSRSAWQLECQFTTGMPCFIPEEAYGTTVELSDDQKTALDVYELYEKYLDDETWPRPYYAVDEANRLSELTTDIFTLVETKMAKWVVGTENLEADWEQYKADLKRMGSDEMLKIYQDAYNRYLAGMPK